MRKLPTGWATDTGLTLVELLVALALGQLIIVIGAASVMSNVSIVAAASEVLTLHEIAHGAIDNIAFAIRHAGYISHIGIDTPDSGFQARSKLRPAVFGLDASTLPATSNALDGARPNHNNHSSDVLALRFALDGNVPNCAGISTISDEIDQGWSIYYVANDKSGVPNLYCKFKGKHFTAQSIAHGVDSFQVLYRLNDRNQFLNAAALNELDSTLPTTQLSANSTWTRVTAVNITLQMRGTESAHALFNTTIALRNPQR